MSTLAPLPDLPHSRLLPATVVLAAVLHAALILGVSFTPFLEQLRTPPELEVILVQKSDSDAPDEADYLAQAAQDGGGDSDENERPASPFSSDQVFDNDGVAPVPVAASSPEQRDAADESVLTSVFSKDEVAVDEEQVEAEPDEPQRDTFIVQQNMDIARLAAEIDRQQQEYAKRPKKKWLTARTHEASSAEYMYRWVEKVERVGNLNYPDEARRRHLTGALVLVVGIYKNGQIESVVVDESSGHRLLDDAARRIVELAGPFEPLSGKLAEETDILYIVRTWEFQSSNSMISY